MRYLILIISLLPFLATAQDTTTYQGNRFNLVIDGNITIEEVVDVYESPMLHDIQWGTAGAHDSTFYSLDVSFQSTADKVDFQLVCGTDLAVQGGWVPQTTGRNGFVEHTFTLSCQKDIQIHFEASTADKIYSISEHIPSFALQLTEAEEAWVDSVKKKDDIEMAHLKITNDSLKWANAGHDNAVFLLSHPSVTQAFWDDVSAGGGNLRVYFWDGTQEIAVARQVVDVDTVAKTGQIYFDSSNSLADTANEWRVYAESGATEPAAADPIGSEAVWTNYIKVDHAGGGTDSSLNNNIGTAQNGITSAGQAGKLGEGTLYDSSLDQYFRLNKSLITGNSNFTMSAWVNIPSGITDSATLFSQGTTDGSGTNRSYFYAYHSSTGFSRLFIHPTGQILTGSDLRGAGWVKLEFRRNGDVFSIWENGLQVATSTVSQTFGTAPDVSGLGAAFNLSGNALSGFGFDKYLDEFIIYNGARSDNFLNTEYNNQSDPTSFWTVEYVTASTTTALSGTINGQLALSGDTIESATLNGQSLSEFAFSGSLYESAILSGLTESNSLISGDLSEQATLGGEITSLSDLQGAIIESASLGGQTSTLSDLQGSLVMNAVLSGQVSVESVLSGNVIIVDEGVLSLSGSVDAQTSMSGNLSVLKQVRGIIESQTNLSGSIIQQASLSGDVLTVSTTSAETLVTQTLSGAAFVSSSLSGELSLLGEAWVGRIDITNSPMHTIQFKIKPMHTINIQVKS